MIPYVPAPNTNLGSINNNFAVVQATVYNLHKIDTKIDYQITDKLRVSGRFGYQPYFNQQNPFFGQFLGGSSGGWSAILRQWRRKLLAEWRHVGRLRLGNLSL